MNLDNNLNPNRLYNNYYLDEWLNTDKQQCQNPCDLCELGEECDRLADDLNDIYYLMCCSKGIIKDTNYKINHPNAYFKKI